MTTSAVGLNRIKGSRKGEVYELITKTALNLCKKYHYTYN